MPLHPGQPRCLWFILILSIWSLPGIAQQTEEEIKPAPKLETNRAEEDYSYLKDTVTTTYQKVFAEGLKFIPLNADQSVYFSLGGGYRSRVEHFTNKDWTTEDETYYSQRLSLHADLNVGKNVRFFGEFYHGYTSDTLKIFQSDDLDWHQGFVEFKFQRGDKSEVNVLLGRQELSFGATRLVGIRDGTNMRRSFDLGRVVYSKEEAKIQLFYGKEVNPRFEAFDNSFSLFDDAATNPQIWGVYLQLPIKKLFLTDELYYIGFRSKAAGFSDVFGEEIRHTLGLRRVGTVGKHFSFNTELIYQFGTLGNSTISAFNLETDWKYSLSNLPWRPIVGIKLDFSSGDREIGDDKLQTFNPLFVNPAVYSLAAVNTPANLSSFHPNLTFFPMAGLTVYLDYAFFYRTNKNDGLYTPPRFQIREANGIEERHIGDAFGASISYVVNRNIKATLMGSYFIAAPFIEASGPSENILFIAPTISFFL